MKSSKLKIGLFFALLLFLVVAGVASAKPWKIAPVEWHTDAGAVYTGQSVVSVGRTVVKAKYQESLESNQNSLEFWLLLNGDPIANQMASASKNGTYKIQFGIPAGFDGFLTLYRVNHGSVVDGCDLIHRPAWLSVDLIPESVESCGLAESQIIN